MSDHSLQNLAAVEMTLALAQLTVQGGEDGKGLAAITGFARIGIDFATVSGNDFPQLHHGEPALCSGCGDVFGNGEVVCRHLAPRDFSLDSPSNPRPSPLT